MRSPLCLLALMAGVAGCRPGGSGSPAPSGGGLSVVTVHEVLSQPGLTGRTVQVTGRCLGYSIPTIAKGSPPRTRSDWQLEDGGEAVWVSGALPEGCTATTPAGGATTIRGMVAQDTLPALGGGSPQPRQYLVRN